MKMFRPLLITASLAAGLTLTLAGSLKALDPGAFAGAVAQHHGLQVIEVEVFAWLAILIELAAGLATILCLMAHRTRLAGLIATAMFLGLTAYAAWLLAFPPPKPVGCGCGFSNVPLTPDGWRDLLIRNGLITAALSALVSVAPLPQPTTEPQKARAPSPSAA